MPKAHPSSTPALHHSNPLSIHFIGIGGTGMNGVAQLAAYAGHTVSGSDRATGLRNEWGQYDETCRNKVDVTFHGLTPELSIFQRLENMNIRIVPQDGSGITKQTDAVVYSTAIEPSNPDIQQSNLLGIPLLHRADMLAQLCEGKEVITVAGTAGKSTVTGLLGWIFQCLEKDPTVYCGAPVLNWKQSGRGFQPLASGRDAASTLGNVRFGNGPWIIEVDESDKSFLKFHPDHAIITNIAEDHFELSELRKLFAQFESQVSGIVIKQPDVFQGLENLFPRSGKEKCAPTQSVPMIGKHNLENTANALTLCKALGLDMQKCIEAVSTFKGIERRLERHGPKVIDDFAHSPIKIAAALEAVSDVFPAFSVYWRPHGYTPLFQGLDGFIEVFSNVWKSPCEGTRPTDNCRPGDPTGRFENLFILPVYYAGGTVDRKITSEQFVEKLKEAGVPAEFVPDFQTLEKRLIEENLPVLGMGARDPELPRFARQIAEVIR